MRVIVWLALCVAAVAADSSSINRIVGGSVTNIREYPDITALLFSSDFVNFRQLCGGSILNQRSVLTAAHCFDNARDNPQRWRYRVGSTYSNNGGVQHMANQIIIHPSYNSRSFDSDLAIMRSISMIVYSNSVQPATLVGPNYYLGDNQVVWAAGWGATEFAASSVQLRHVQVYTINQNICRQRYGAAAITDNMLCSGVLDVGGRDQCQGDSGGPLYHNRYVVGVCSWGYDCASPFYPGVNVRISRFTSWIQANAV